MRGITEFCLRRPEDPARDSLPCFEGRFDELEKIFHIPLPWTSFQDESARATADVSFCDLDNLSSTPRASHTISYTSQLCLLDNDKHPGNIPCLASSHGSICS